MKDFLRNPTFYYILGPAVAAIWPLLVRGVYLPEAEKTVQSERYQYEIAQQRIIEILTLDPDRREFVDPNGTATEFNYAHAVGKVASLCRIPSTNYTLSSGMMMTSDRQKSQSAKVVLRQVSITQFARFLSSIQFRWPKLKCERLKITSKKGLPDVWDVDIDFKYYY